MTELPDLVRAVVANHHEDTPVAMLADHLLERGDQRGLLLKKWLEGNRQVGTYDSSPYIHPSPVASQRSPHHREDFGVRGEEGSGGIGTGLEHGARAYRGQPVFKVIVHSRLNSPMGTSGSDTSRIFSVPVEHHEARTVADSLPNGEEFHNFLNAHYGPDPRPQPDKYARDYSRALKSE